MQVKNCERSSEQLLLLSFYMSSKVSLSLEMILRLILDSRRGCYAEGGILFSLDHKGRALSCIFEVTLLLQVDNEWSEKGSDGICKSVQEEFGATIYRGSKLRGSKHDFPPQ